MERCISKTPVKDIFIGKEHLALIFRTLRMHGFNCGAYKASYLERRVQTRLRSNHLNSYRDYYRLLRENPGELKALLDVLTINVTGFFRDSDIYEYLRLEVIPDILSLQNREKRSVRIWSAGCATGEEPYSVAMLLLEALAGNCSNHAISIYATDIDDRSLSAAAEGTYSLRKLETVPEAMAGKYFTYDDNYKVKDSIKSLIKFKKLDLLTDKGIKLCDAIFCRNVLIYFNQEDQEQVLKMFYENLKPGGYLILGKTEIMLSDMIHKFSNAGVKNLFRKMPI